MRPRTILTAAVAATAALSGASSALAAGDAVSVATNETISGHHLNQAAEGRVLTQDARSKKIALRCSATAEDASGVGVAQCYLLGADGRRFGVPAGSMPGVTYATTAVLDVPAQRYRVCVQGNAIIRLESTFITGTLACSP